MSETPAASRIARLRATRPAAVIGAVWRGLVKVIMTTWRFARALDSALWRGVRYGAGAGVRGAGDFVRAVVSAVVDLFRWLPTRVGRAYTALSGVVLIIAALWILDELRVSPNARGAVADGLLRPPTSVSDPAVARVDGRYIYLSEVRAAAVASGALAPGDQISVKTAFQRKLVQAYVDQRILSRAAAEAGVQRNPEVQRQLTAARERILASAYLEGRIASTVTEAAARKLYNAQVDATRGGEEVRARIIVVASEDDAIAVADALSKGADFAGLARSLSIDVESGARGGDLGFFGRDGGDPAVAAVAFSTASGARAAPFQTEKGWAVLEVLARRRVGGVAYESVRDEVKRFLRLKTIDATMTALKQDSEVVYYSGDPARPK